MTSTVRTISDGSVLIFFFNTRAGIAILGLWRKQQKWSISRPMMGLCNKTYFFTLVTEKFGNMRIPISIVSLPCSVQKKFNVLFDFMDASIDRGADHFFYFAPSPEITFPFARIPFSLCM